MSNEEMVMQNMERFLKTIKPYRWSIEGMQAMIKSTYIKYSISLNQKIDMLELLRKQHIKQDNNIGSSSDESEVYFVGSTKTGFKYLVDKDYNIIQSAKDLDEGCFIYRNNFIAEVFKNSRDKYTISRIFNTSGKELLDLVKLSKCKADDYRVDIKQIRDRLGRVYLIVNLGDINREYSNINTKAIVYRYDDNEQILDKVYQVGTNSVSVAKVVKFVESYRVETKEVVLITYQANAMSISQITDNDDIVKSLIRKMDYESDERLGIDYDDNELRKVFIDNLGVTVIKIFDIDTFVEYTYIDTDEAFMECIQIVEYDEKGNKVCVTDRNRENKRDFRKIGLYDRVIDSNDKYTIGRELKSIGKDYLYRISQYDVKHGINGSKCDNAIAGDKVYEVNIFADDGKQRSLIEGMSMEMPNTY